MYIYPNGLVNGEILVNVYPSASELNILLAFYVNLTLTTPLRKPSRSAKSTGRSFAAPLRFFVLDLKIPPAPLR